MWVFSKYIYNEHEDKVLFHIPIAQLFELHRLNTTNLHLWDHMNLKGFFELEPWGLNYMRAYQTFSTMAYAYNCTISDFPGEQHMLHMTRQMVRETSNMPQREGINFFKLTHIYDKNKLCMYLEKPT